MRSTVILALLASCLVLTACEPKGVCVADGYGGQKSCKFGSGYELDKKQCDIQEGVLHPFVESDKGGEYERGKETCRTLGYPACGSGECGPPSR